MKSIQERIAEEALIKERIDAEGNIIVSDDLDSRNPWLVSRGMYGKW